MGADDEQREHSGPAGSDAERRFARAAAAELRATGRETRIQAVWIRPAWWLVQALCAGAGVVASVVSVDTPLAGLIVAAAALLLAIADVTRVPLLRRLTIARATQDVVSPPPRRDGERAVTLVITAPLDRLRRGLPYRLHVPLIALSLASLAVVAACAGARLADVDATWLSAVQLVPTIVLLVALVAFLDQGFAEPFPDDRATEAALALVRQLDADPPRHLDVAVVLAGAGSSHGAGLRAWLAGRRARGMRPSDVAIVDLQPHAGSEQVWWERDGVVFATGLHPQLRSAARGAAAGDPELGARAVTGPDATGAGVARGAGWPAIAVGVGDDARVSVAFAEALVRDLDERLATPASG